MTTLQTKTASGDIACARCTNDLDENSLCRDETCPFSDHVQACKTGWSGHPDMDPYPLDDDMQISCSCPEPQQETTGA